MIRLQRDRSAIPVGLRGSRLRVRQVELLQARLTGDAPRDSVWKVAKAQLKAETHGKCAYCEADTSVVAFGDVEHFRPKSIYWWLAYCYDNYTYSCQICNQENKSDRFPVGGTQLIPPALALLASAAGNHLLAMAPTISPDPSDATAVTAHHSLTSTEGALLPDPYTVDPEQYFSWFTDDALKQVEIRPRPRVVNAPEVHAAVVAVLGLNREELLGLRYRVMHETRLLARLTRVPQLGPQLIAETKGLLREKVDARAQFAAVARYALELEGMGPARDL